MNNVYAYPLRYCHHHTIRYDTMPDAIFNVRSKAVIIIISYELISVTLNIYGVAIVTTLQPVAVYMLGLGLGLVLGLFFSIT